METRKVIRHAGTVGALTMLSRTLGLVRDVLMAGLFGTSLTMSAFVVAFRIPNLFRAFFGEGALSAAFVPVFVETRARDGSDAAWRLARQVFTFVGAVLVLLVAAGIAGMALVRAAADLTPKADLILQLTQVLLPYMIFICLAAVSMGALNALHVFAVPAFAPSLLNMVWIAAALAAGRWFANQPDRQILLVAWSIVGAGVLQWLVQQPALYRRGFRGGPTLDLGDARLRRILKLMGPAALGQAVTRVNVMIDTFLAAWIGAWAPAALFFSERLIYLPLGLFATALGTVLLPVFSRQKAAADHAAMRRTMNQSLRSLLFVMIPAAAGLLALARPITQLVFEWRSFTGASTDYTAVALAFYAPGLLVFSLAKVFVPAFYAMQDTRTPVRVGLFTVTLNIVLSVAFMLTWPLPLKHAGIAFATVVAEAVYALTLAVLLHRMLGSPGWRSILTSAGRALVCAVAMAGAVIGAERVLKTMLASHGAAPKLAQAGAVLGAIATGLAVYAAAAWILRCPELREAAAALRRKTARHDAGSAS